MVQGLNEVHNGEPESREKVPQPRLYGKWCDGAPPSPITGKVRQKSFRPSKSAIAQESRGSEAPEPQAKGVRTPSVCKHFGTTLEPVRTSVAE